MSAMVKGWDRGLVDGGYTMGDAEAWQAWSDSMAARWPEATLLQIFKMTDEGEFEAFEGEGDDDDA